MTTQISVYKSAPPTSPPPPPKVATLIIQQCAIVLVSPVCIFSCEVDLIYLVLWAQMCRLHNWGGCGGHVFTLSCVSDLAQHFLMKNNITAIRRLRKTDNNRIARSVTIIVNGCNLVCYVEGVVLGCDGVLCMCVCRVCGAVICNRTDELSESDVGTECGLFEVRMIGDEYFTYLVDCKEPKACTIVLRGASKDILHEVSG